MHPYAWHQVPAFHWCLLVVVVHSRRRESMNFPVKLEICLHQVLIHSFAAQAYTQLRHRCGPAKPLMEGPAFLKALAVSCPRGSSSATISCLSWSAWPSSISMVVSTRRRIKNQKPLAYLRTDPDPFKSFSELLKPVRNLQRLTLPIK
jgi:hypothetical protein